MTTTPSSRSSNKQEDMSMFEIVKTRVQSKPDVPLSKIRDQPNQPFNSHVCLGCGKKQSACPNIPFSSCSRCHAVKYCSKDCQVADWKGKGNGPTKPRKHKDLCKELQQAIQEFQSHPTAGIALRTQVFPDWANQHGPDGTFHLAEFLARKNLLGGKEVGFWATPNVLTPYHTAGPDMQGFQNGQMLLDEAFPTMEQGWNLPPCERIDVTQPPSNPLPRFEGITSWQDYLTWRELPPTSVAPLLMTNVLTIYQMIQHELQLPALPTQSFLIYVLAVEAELNQIPLLQELLYLLPDGLDIRLVYLSPAVKALCDQRTDHPNCLLSKPDCIVLDRQYGNSRLRVQLDSKHALYDEVPNTVTPTAVLGLNTGLPSYKTWAPAMHKLLRQGTPFCFSDQTHFQHSFAVQHWLPHSVIDTINRAFPQYTPLEMPTDLSIRLNPFHGIVGRDVAFVLAPNLSNGYLLTGFPE